MSRGARPDPENLPVGLEKDMSKFEIEDIPRYIKYRSSSVGRPRRALPAGGCFVPPAEPPRLWSLAA
jgi:hypothetical protein